MFGRNSKLIVMALGLALMGVALYLSNQDDAAPTEQATSAERKIDLEPHIREFEAENAAAAANAIARIQRHLDSYADKVPLFTDEAMSFQSRAKIGYFEGKQLFKTFSFETRSPETEAYLRELMLQTVFTPPIEQCIEEALLQYAHDVNANLAKLSSKIAYSITQTDSNKAMPSQEVLDAIAKHVKSMIDDTTRSTLLSAMIELIASQAAEKTFNTLVWPIVANIAETTANSIAASVSMAAATSAGTTASSSFLGATAGTSIGPVGTATGLAVGLAVGFAVDLYSTGKNKDVMNQDMRKRIVEMNTAILHGSGAGDTGITGRFHDLNAQYATFVRASVTKIIH
jgi:hypothetical protein